MVSCTFLVASYFFTLLSSSTVPAELLMATRPRAGAISYCRLAALSADKDKLIAAQNQYRFDQAALSQLSQLIADVKQHAAESANLLANQEDKDELLENIKRIKFASPSAPADKSEAS